MPKKYAKKYKSRNKRTRKIKGGIASDYNSVFKGPSWQSGARQWTTLVKIRGLNVYGSSIPHEDVYSCLATFQFYLHVKNIKRIISLQGCDIDDGHRPSNCNGYLPPDSRTDTKYESRVWNAVKQVSLVHNEDSQVEFVNHKIVDMTVGNLTEWRLLYNYNYNDPNQITLIHCLAGFGRTGIILFLIYLRYYYENHRTIVPNLLKPHLGYENGKKMISRLMDMFYQELILDDDAAVNGDCNNKIKSFKRVRIIEELVNIKGRDGNVSLHLANLLITRMNYVLICLALGFKTDRVFLYKKVADPNITFKDLFVNPDEKIITELDVVLNDPANIYGIRM
jgi:hypothetical protein